MGTRSMSLPQFSKQLADFGRGSDDRHRNEYIRDLSARLKDAEALIQEMVGLDKGPYEDEYVEWNDRALAFLGVPVGVRSSE